MSIIYSISAYLILMNFLGLFSMGLDKWKAKHRAWRIPEVTLFVICILGGSIGATMGMFAFHHKTKHWYFRYGFPIIMAIHLILAAFIIGSGKFMIM